MHGLLELFPEMRTIASFPDPSRRIPANLVSMTEKKTSEFSARLGGKRSKPASTSNPPVSTPPTAAVATTKPKQEETRRRKVYFNDMLNHRSSTKEKDTRRSTSSQRRVDGRDTRGGSVDAMGGGPAFDSHAAERIAELERTLARVQEEQSAMREELVKVREHECGTTKDPKRNSNHSLHHLQSPPGAFHNDSRPTTPTPNSRSMPMDIDEEGAAVSPHRTPHRTPRRSLNHHRDDVDAENYDLRAQVTQLQDQIQAQELAYQSRLRTEAEWYEITSRLHATEKESQERLQQLLSLKSSISSLTRKDSQITDSELSERLSQLANRVREWVITNFRKAKLDLSNVPPEVVRALEAVSPTYYHIGDRLALFQALISNTLMQIFHDPILIGLPEHGPLASVRQLAVLLYDASPEYREWRRCTIRSIENREGDITIRQEKEKLIHQLARDIAHQLFTLTSTNLTPHAYSALEGILNTAADIQNTLLLQKAHYRMHFFRHQENNEISFDDSRMESINDPVDDDGDAVVDRKFAFCVFPCLEKYGDEYGENTGASNVLLRARVCYGVG